MLNIEAFGQVRCDVHHNQGMTSAIHLLGFGNAGKTLFDTFFVFSESESTILPSSNSTKMPEDAWNRTPSEVGFDFSVHY
jgi:hypothetical protein